jgi:hypothetical protein
VGDACQGTASPPPSSLSPGSAGVIGSGNVVNPRRLRCKADQHKVKRHGRDRCIKNHRRHGR